MVYCSGCHNRHEPQSCPFNDSTPEYEMSDWVRQAIAEIQYDYEQEY